MTKRIYFEPSGQFHPIFNSLIDSPPTGYNITRPSTTWDKGISPLLRNYFLSATVLEAISRRFLPMTLIKSYLEGKFKKLPPDIDLTYAYNHLVFRKEPWIAQVEWVSMLTGFNIKHLHRYKRIVEQQLSSPDCKKIITWTQSAKRGIQYNLDCTGFAHKLQVVPIAVNKKMFTKDFRSDKVRLLFVGSGTMKGHFRLKGGQEVIEVFKTIKQRHDNVEMVIKSDLPDKMKAQCKEIGDIRIIDKHIPWTILEKEFQRADIFLYPSRTPNTVVILDAMSYELPVIALDMADRSEMIQNGVTGFLVNESTKLPTYEECGYVPPRQTPFRQLYEREIREIDIKVVRDLTDKTSTLITNADLRRKMGRAGRLQVEEGKFSIARRNQKLKNILDEATTTAIGE